ncbi:DUF4937 domain-containing protein [Vibrio mangrovi]|uniref:Antibiotic biosynthesis monooxygenase n=1 Tax=Vibrio mangrovi TaxID=474394 RepID=A0A1Y6J002_9VIBR|nr:DUF4937 domain-containing protein [Vibrio mangrovi]MDW6002257.1 DUF4937 domain-containing protein [Vibrio mangrovi]SMS01603.1 Antibiotic biosynthesis monooxygenase [Vibrio mangrovi]
MIIKLITCQVEKDQKQNFSRSQQAWGKLSDIDGFAGQFGGWNKSEDQAIVIGVWDSYAHVQQFMASVHDEIFLSSGQQNTYQQCEVHYFEKVLTIRSLTNITEPTNHGIFRVAYCRGVQDTERFLCDQREVWNVYMGRADGMLGGYVLRSLEHDDYFVVISHWASEQHHQNYVQHIFPELINKVEPANYIKDLSGCLIQEEQAWQVEPHQSK